MSLKLFGHSVHGVNPRMFKVKIAAHIAGLKIEDGDIAVSQKDKAAWTLNCHPLGASPVLETENGYIFESNAILRHVARLGRNAGLYGTTDFEASQIDSWLDYALSEVDIYTLNLALSAAGFFPLSAEAVKEMSAGAVTALEGIDKWLETRTYLVGDRLTIADLAIFGTIDVFLRGVPTCGDAYKLKNVYRYYLTVLHQPKVQEALKAGGHDGLIPAKPKEEKAAPAPAAAKAEKPKKEEKKADDEEMDIADAAAQEKKKPNPLDALPPSKFVLDEFKREYSNKDIRKEAAPFFFDKFDPEGFSAYWCTYKYNEENKMQFMTANLVRGWFQRMDHVRKYAFGTALLVGENTKHDIVGLWIFRGKGIPEIVSEVDDTDLFNWTEIPDVNAEREKITDYFAWDGETFKEKPVLEGRTFK